MVMQTSGPSRPACEPDRAAFQQSRDPVLDRVFDQGLQQERGDHAIQARVADLLVHLQAFAEADALDLQVAARQGQFLAQGDGVALAEAQAAAEKVRQPDAHFAGPGAVGCGQRADRMEAVEQEVRIDLDAQRLQFRLAGQHARLGGVFLGFTGRSGCQRGVVQPHRNQVEQHAHSEEHRQARHGRCQ